MASFLHDFRQIHDWVDQKYEKKVLVVIDTQRVLSYTNVMDTLTHKTVINGICDWILHSNIFDVKFHAFSEIPLTLLLQPNVNNEWIYVWSAYPYESHSQNRFFIGNFSLEYDKQIIPKITDLNGLIVTGAFMNYPPYTYYERVVSKLRMYKYLCH